MSESSRTFKERLLGGERLFGLWVSSANALTAEICAGAGFDWLVIDAEHAPNDLGTVLAQLHAIGCCPTHPIVRPTRHDPALLKQYLDLGARTLLVPMVDNATEAAALVRAVRYPPAGIRGVATARAAGWGRRPDYFDRADSEVCLIVQVETMLGVGNLESIAAVDGVDAIFIGPSDLAASMGYLGRASDPAVREAVVSAIAAVRHAGKPAGVLTVSQEAAVEYLSAGATFVGVGVDTLLLAQATSDLASRFSEFR